MIHPQQQPNLTFEELEGLDEVIIINPDNNRCVSLNLTAAAVLEMCDGRHDIHAIVTELSTAFDTVDPQQITADVEAILQQLHEYQLINT